MVIGMGAYSAGPVVVAAWVCGIHRVICEQNSLPGLTNRLLAKFAERIYVSFPDTGFKDACQPKIRFTGNPVRRAIFRADAPTDKRENFLDRENSVFTVLILGGSQGAHGINVAVLDSVMYLDHPEKFRFVHQSGLGDQEEVRKVYLQMRIDATVAAFFEDMAALYQAADLVICRSGATTVAELTIAGKAVIFIPFPHAADNHQVSNAQALVADGAADMIEEADLSGELLARRIAYYAENPEIRREMGEKMKKFSHPDAARRIVDDIYGILGISNIRRKTMAEA
jgi:UDP-N-acetylglucosamine--N-acetylmuramyl-(pentapeptide) pyrophosphoryl-undecaprenol N-acetylglucosamine transferase